MGIGKKVAFLFPGQGSQYVGMGKDLSVFEVAKRTFEEADDILKENLSHIIWEGPADLLTETKNSQLAIFVVSCAVLNTLRQEVPELAPSCTAGLSLGEYSAFYAAGKISFRDALLLVQKRALFMDEACRKRKGAMAAVLGLETSKAEMVLESLRVKQHKEVWIANYNSPGQIVISGSPDAVEFASLPLKEAGAKRVIPLQVHGAFHSPFMQLAQDKLEPYIRSTKFVQSPIKVAMNVPGNFTSFDKIPDFLLSQVTSSVRWDQSILALKEKGIDLYIELGCGKTLTGLMRKILPEAECLSIEKAVDLEAFLGSLSKI